MTQPTDLSHGGESGHWVTHPMYPTSQDSIKLFKSYDSAVQYNSCPCPPVIIHLGIALHLNALVSSGPYANAGPYLQLVSHLMDIGSAMQH